MNKLIKVTHQVEFFEREPNNISKSMSTDLIFYFIVNSDGITAFKYILFCSMSYQFSYRDLNSQKIPKGSYFPQTEF